MKGFGKIDDVNSRLAHGISVSFVGDVSGVSCGSFGPDFGQQISMYNLFVVVIYIHVVMLLEVICCPLQTVRLPAVPH